jgi:hypothetical protein
VQPPGFLGRGAGASRICSIAVVGITSRPPKWIKPQLTRLVDEAPTGGGWLHEIKYDGYRMHARLDGGDIRLLSRTCPSRHHGRFGAAALALAIARSSA